MSVLLLCNVGNRDVQVDEAVGLPAEVCHPRGNVPIPRLAGDYLRQPEVFKQAREHIRMPMVEKALRYVAPRDKSALQIVLFATDQPEHTAPNYRNNDTVLYADIMRDVLFERYQREGLVKRQIFVKTTSHNPADYDLMHDYYRATLPKIQQHSSADTKVYLLVAGGTPAMNTMLLFMGSAVFQSQAHPIYVSEEHDYAFSLDIMRQMQASVLQRNLKILLEAYAYATARKLIEQTPGTLEDWQEGFLLATLHYAEERRHFRMNEAARALDVTLPTTRVLRDSVHMLRQEVSDNSDRTMLQETIFLAQVAAETGNWLDFLSRLYRFSEGCMQLIAEELGVLWGDTNRASYQQEWWETHRDDLSNQVQQAVEQCGREVNRANLRLVIAELAARQEARAIQSALTELEVVDRPVALRNRVVHDFAPLSRIEIEERATVHCDAVLVAMRRAYHHAFGVPVPAEHPYTYINQFCVRILEGKR